MSPDVHTLTGAYVLDALDELERRQFERHLVECPDCAREVEELRATAAVLGTAVAEPPPDHLRRHVLEQVARTRQEPPGMTSRATARRTVRWGLRLTAAAAVLAVLAAIGLGAAALHTQHQLTAVQDELVQLQNSNAPIARVLSAPDTRAANATAAGGGNAIMLVSHQLNEAVLVVSNMPSPPADHVYQVWLMGPNPPHSAGLLSAGTVVPPLAFSGLPGAQQIGVTVEPAGGSKQPTTNPIMQFDIPA